MIHWVIFRFTEWNQSKSKSKWFTDTHWHSSSEWNRISTIHWVIHRFPVGKRTKSMSERFSDLEIHLINEKEFGSWMNDSLSHSLIYCMKHQRMSVSVKKRFTDSSGLNLDSVSERWVNCLKNWLTDLNTDSLNKTRANFSTEWKIHRFQHWFKHWVMERIDSPWSFIKHRQFNKNCSFFFLIYSRNRFY